LYGVGETQLKTAPFNDKKLDVMVDVFARSVLPAIRSPHCLQAATWLKFP
jgi:hypothetical protein